MLNPSEIVNLTKEAINIADSLKHIELQKKLLAIEGEALNLKEEVLDLRRRNQELEATEDFKAKADFHDNAYWVKRSNGGEDGPFCSTCLDAKGKPIRMIVNGSGYADCHNCNSKSILVNPSEAARQSRFFSNDSGDGLNFMVE